MIDIIATKTLEIIIGQVKEARFYSVECDEVTSHKHSYVSIVLRYVYQSTIYERVVGLNSQGAEGQKPYVNLQTGRQIYFLIKLLFITWVT